LYGRQDACPLLDVKKRSPLFSLHCDRPSPIPNPCFAATFNEGKDMKIRESQGQSVWNHSEGWCCQPLDPIPPGHIALAVEAIALDLVEWDLEEIGEKAGFDVQYKYMGVNDPKDESLACVSQASRHL
jgi:hypothetical protein